MGLQMNNLMGNAQDRFKSSSLQVFTWVIKILSGSMLGLTFALIGEEILGYGTFSFIFVILVVLGAFMKIAKNWRLMSVLLFSAFCILVGTLLKMYILIAPGA